MRNWVRDLDRILRGEATRIPALDGGTIETSAGGLSVVIVGLAALYGVCMGCYAIFGLDEPRPIQMLATAVKVPALFFLTLLVTFPSLYVFNALVGSRLTMRAVFRLLIAALGVNLAVLASLGPIVAFFSLNTTSYPFMVLLNVLVFAVSGALGLLFLLRTLHRLHVAQRRMGVLPRPETDDAMVPEQSEPSEGQPSQQPEGVPLAQAEVVEESGALDWMEGHVLGRHVKTVFACWVVVFGLVGAQMSWVLRPFIGSPDQKFEWFRRRESTFFEAVFDAVGNLFS